VFQDDGYTEADIERLMKAHSDQPLDFFGALRARMYDEGILNWMRDDVGEARIPDVFRDLARPCRGLVQQVIGKEVPQFSGEGLDMSIERLLKCGQELQQEQQNVKDHQLAQEYMRWQVLPEVSPLVLSRPSCAVKNPSVLKKNRSRQPVCAGRHHDVSRCTPRTGA
jgi:hypothetical protein